MAARVTDGQADRQTGREGAESEGACPATIISPPCPHHHQHHRALPFSRSLSPGRRPACCWSGS